MQEDAFYALIEEVVSRLQEKQGHRREKWVSDDQAMQLLNIKSKTTLQKLRDEGKSDLASPRKKSFFMTEIPLKHILSAIIANHFNYGRSGQG
ncbi:DNA-binding protein [Siphonobacter sp. SORGH_AS_0500]|uniref:DNA-binding protein n=1 Tax=Siphonobacter sp. SORGH_AS_0500 TaxID=1864824 RepID=UPI001E42BF41|nr:DNA-binding protein [Siphonobacter sp. SORGH_AS_0500]